MSLFNELSRFTTSTAVITDVGERVSYADLALMADELFSKINCRCLVFCLCENSLGSIAGYVACLRNRAVPLLLAKDLNPELLDSLLDQYQPEYLYIPLGLAERFSNLETVFSACRYLLKKTCFPARQPLFEELALLLTTSGSTGSPKLVRLSYRNVVSNAEAIAGYLQLNASEKPITTLAMNYTYGLSIINSHLLVGGTLLVTGRSIMEKGFWDFFKDQGATSFGGVPYTYEMLKRLRFFKMELPSLRTMTQAGGKLNPDLTREFALFAESRNLQFYVMYGQTEATARMSYLPPRYAVSKCGSMGIPIPGGDFSLVNEQGRLIGTADTPGELVYKGPNVALGYAECRDGLAKGDEFGGVLMTGDMAMRDEEGFYYITGRKKRFIKLYGNRVNLDEAELLLRSIIPDCACAGRDDHMVVYMTEVGREQEVRLFIAGQTGINPAAFEVKVIARIPKNEAGKTLYTHLP